jgi:hypothetical protein
VIEQLSKEDRDILFFAEGLKESISINKKDHSSGVTTKVLVVEALGKCLLEFVLIHDSGRRYISIFLGKEKIEFCDYEPINNPEEISGIVSDIKKLLESNVKITRVTINVRIKKASYHFSKLDPGIQLKHGSSFSFLKKEKEKEMLEPWI